MEPTVHIPSSGQFKVPTIFLRRKYGSNRAMSGDDFKVVYDQLHLHIAERFQATGGLAATIYLMQIGDEAMPKVGHVLPVDISEHMNKDWQRGTHLACELLEHAMGNKFIDFAVMVSEADLENEDGNVQTALVFNMLSRECQAIAITGFKRGPDGKAKIDTKGELQFASPDSDITGTFVRRRKIH